MTSYTSTAVRRPRISSGTSSPMRSNRSSAAASASRLSKKAMNSRRSPAVLLINITRDIPAGISIVPASIRSSFSLRICSLLPPSNDATRAYTEDLLGLRPRTLLRSEAGELAQRREPREGLPLELPDALARQVELVADRLECPGLALEAEPQLQDPSLALGKSVQRLADVLAAKRFLGLVEWIGGFAVCEEIAKLALVVGADGLVQRDGRGRGRQSLVDVLDREARGFRELVLRRLAAELHLEPPRCARELLLALDDVHRHADRAPLVCHGALH